MNANVRDMEAKVASERVLPLLEGLYASSRKLSSAWVSEVDSHKAIVDALEAALADRYEIGDPLGVGGSGVVLRVRDIRLGIDRALKYSRPTPGKSGTLAVLLKSETDRLVELAHPYIMRVHARDEVSVGATLVPYYVMDLFTNAMDADAYVNQARVQEYEIIRIVERTLEAVAFMHAQGQVHLDIKPGNILIREDDSPVLSDLGFAKVLKEDSGLTFIGGTEGYVHPSARKLMNLADSDPNLLQGETSRHLLSRRMDLYSLGQTLLTLLRVIDEREDTPLSLYSHRYLKLVACRLLDGENTMKETLLGLSQRTFDEIKYASAEEALIDINKLTGSYSLQTRVPELNQFGADTIQASTFATTPFTARVKSLVEHPEVARLGGVSQLSLLNLVYPTATHTRLEHTIGTFSAMCRYVIALDNDPINPLFRQLMTEADVRAALVVALVHDVGHYGLAHDLEEAEAKIFSHEERGKELLLDAGTGLRAAIEAERLPDGALGWGVSIERIVGILDADVPKMAGTVKDRLIHSMINGPIDADKLDYIIRDSLNLGLTYGSVIDVERLLRVLTVIMRQSGSETYVNVGIHEKGRVTAEAVAFARYALYGSVYWHHAYRAVKAMLQRVAWEYLDQLSKNSRTAKMGISKTVRAKLYPMLRATGGGASQSLPLTSIVGAGQMHAGDMAMLEWLSERAGTTGKELAKMIEERRLYKRVYVVSKWGNANLWESVTKRLSEANWRRRLAFQRSFQERLANAVAQSVEFDAITKLNMETAQDLFLAAVKSGSAIVLVDATPERPGATSGLELIQEEDRRRAKIDELPMSAPEQSALWGSLRTGLQQSVGKVRVVCHPDHARFVSALDRSMVEEALAQALNAD